MNIKLKINLPEPLIESAKRIGNSTERDIKTVITDILEMLLPTFDNLLDDQSLVDLSQLSGLEVLELANSKMNKTQNKRLGELQTKGKNQGLTEAEQYELSSLIHIYQIGQLRK